MSESKRIEYRHMPKYKYQVTTTLVFETNIHPETDIAYPPEKPLVFLTTAGKMTIGVGYAFDGITGFFDLKSMMRGAAGHDVALQLIQLDLLPRIWKEAADRLLVRLATEDGLSRPLQPLVYQAVKRFGYARRRDLNKFDEIHIAP